MYVFVRKRGGEGGFIYIYAGLSSLSTNEEAAYVFFSGVDARNGATVVFSDPQEETLVAIQVT